MFALRQIDREPAVRPAANENCLVLGEGRSLPFSHFSLPLPFLALFLLPLLFWLSAARLSTVLFPVYQSSSGMAAPAHTVVHTLFPGAPRTEGFTVSQTGPGWGLGLGMVPSLLLHQLILDFQVRGSL